MLNLKCKQIKRDLCAWLVKCFDPEGCALNVYEKSLKFSPVDVELIMGLRNEGADVERSGAPDRIIEVCESLFKGLKVIPLKVLEGRLCEMKGDSVEFKRIFALFVLGYLLLPTMKTTVSTSSIHSIIDIGGLGKKNWVKLVYDGVITGVQKCKLNNQHNISGCILVLMVINCVLHICILLLIAVLSEPDRTGRSDRFNREPGP